MSLDNITVTNLEKAVDWGCVRSLAGRTFCLTGAMSLTRTDMERVIKALGGEAQDAVRASTDYLIVPEGNEFRKGSKYNQAVAQGKLIISEEEFVELFMKTSEELLAVG